jgi:putative peptidoglycan lipid II flippase
LFIAVAVNVTLKILLMDPYAQAGLAFATSVGAWINLALLVWFAARQGLLDIDRRLKQSAAKFAIAGAALAAALYLCERPVAGLFSAWMSLRDEATLLVLGAIGILVYGGTILALFGRQLLALFRGRPQAGARLQDQ